MPTSANEQPTVGADHLRADLTTEYYAILGVVSEYDGRLMIIKGWSVTLSLAGLALGFQEGHSALFGLSALAGLAFWYLDALMKGFQLRYYSRMRDIEHAAYHLNSLHDLGDLEHVSAPRIDMSWGFTGKRGVEDRRDGVPARRDAKDVRQLLRRAWYLPQVLFPHVVAVVVGAALFLGAALGAPGLDQIPL